MIRTYRQGDRAVETADVCAAGWRLDPSVIWVDLISPTREEELAVEAALGLSIPTREEMSELEASSRLYRENGAAYGIADIVQYSDTEIPTADPVTFVLTSERLITVRYFQPRAFARMVERLLAEATRFTCGPEVFLELAEAIIDRLSDVLSRNASDVEAVARRIFTEGRTAGFEALITRLGHAQIGNARIEQSLAGLARIFVFLDGDDALEKARDGHLRLGSLARDARSLTAHAQAVAANINFQLSAALGLINIQQSSIIKIFSVASVAFLPPTLIASIYGMNFQHMPELTQTWGYPLAIVAMILSAVLPLAYFKKRGWL